jgi:aconitate hydratase
VKDDAVYLCSSVVAAVSALTGVITDPRTLGAPSPVALPARFVESTAGLVEPDGAGDVVRGPNIKPVPLGEPVGETLEAPVLLKLGDKVSTDDISPAGAAVLVFRSNVPAIAEHSFKYVDASFPARAKAAGVGIIVGGDHYGQGSSREVAAIAPMYLGVRAVIAKSFARIHRANLLNWGVVPLTFDDSAAWDTIDQNDRLRLDGLRTSLANGHRVTVTNERSGTRFTVSCILTPRERDILLAGGLLALTRSVRAPASPAQSKGEASEGGQSPPPKESEGGQSPPPSL